MAFAWGLMTIMTNMAVAETLQASISVSNPTGLQKTDLVWQDTDRGILLGVRQSHSSCVHTAFALTFLILSMNKSL